MALINGLFEGGGLQSAGRLVQYTEQRHKLLVDNIANLSTDFYKPKDVRPKTFQKALASAVDQRRQTVNPYRGKLTFGNSGELTFGDSGMQLKPESMNRNILFHDQNNRDLDRTMQDLAENTMAHRMGIELVRNQMDMLRLAIRERI